MVSQSNLKTQRSISQGGKNIFCFNSMHDSYLVVIDSMKGSTRMITSHKKNLRKWMGNHIIENIINCSDKQKNPEGWKWKYFIMCM